MEESLAGIRDTPGLPSQQIVASTADRRLHVIDSTSSFGLVHSISDIQDSPILSYKVLANQIMLAGSMSGRLVLYDQRSGTILGERRDHTKYVVNIEVYHDKTDWWVGTAGWDGKVFLYRIEGATSVHQNPVSTDLLTGASDEIRIGSPIASVSLPTNPEALAFVLHAHVEEHPPLLLLTRRDSTFLYYYGLPSLESEDRERPLSLSQLGKQNLAPHSNAWIAFSPSAISVCPKDPSLIAVATSSIPHMKLLVVRLLLPSFDRVESPTATEKSIIEPTLPVADMELATAAQAAQERARLAIQDREAAAILTHCNTMAPQTPYSTPAVAWRPDGSGVWVNSDDGLIRGIEAKSGKVVATLDGHEAGSKIRCLWAGNVHMGSGREEEFVISGGFDHRLIVWRISEHTT